MLNIKKTILYTIIIIANIAQATLTLNQITKESLLTLPLLVNYTKSDGTIRFTIFCATIENFENIRNVRLQLRNKDKELIFQGEILISESIYAPFLKEGTFEIRENIIEESTLSFWSTHSDHGLVCYEIRLSLLLDYFKGHEESAGGLEIGAKTNPVIEYFNKHKTESKD